MFSLALYFYRSLVIVSYRSLALSGNGAYQAELKNNWEILWPFGFEAKICNVPNLIHKSIYGFQFLFVQRNREKVVKAFFFQTIDVRLWSSQGFSETLKHFNEELQVTEMFVLFKSASNEKEKLKYENRAGYTASCLRNESSESYISKSHKCVYCSQSFRVQEGD